MARNEEKAKSMLNMFLRRHEIGRIEEKRPTNTQKVTSAAECEKWRHHVTREILAEVTAIQSTTLGEQATRAKNDYINDLLRKRYYWEVRIIELAGLDYAEQLGIDVSKERIRLEKERIRQQKEDQALLQGKSLKKRKHQVEEEERKLRELQKAEQHNVDLRAMGLAKDFDGGAVIQVNGYYYFGAAKQLPGVRELFERTQQEAATIIKRGELTSRIDASYYGYQEDDNLALLRQEEEYEKRLLRKFLKQKQNEEAQQAKNAQAGGGGDVMGDGGDQDATDATGHGDMVRADVEESNNNGTLLIMEDDDASAAQHQAAVNSVVEADAPR